MSAPNTWPGDAKVEIPQPTLERMQATLAAALEETEIRHIYLVGARCPIGAMRANGSCNWHALCRKWYSIAFPSPLGPVPYRGSVGKIQAGRIGRCGLF